MTTSDVRPTAAPAPATDGLRIVLFGLPGAGKSSLLGALGEAAKTQEQLLHGRLSDLSTGLAALQLRLYDRTPQSTAEEIVPYPVAFTPFDDAADNPVSAVLFDCDGRVAHDLVARADALENGVPRGKLAAEVVGADSLILPVDCSATAQQLEEEFGAFERFLRELEAGRGARVDVGGLPVFLVLTKCDLLAQPADTTIDWMERVEQRKREVDEHFRAFLDRRGGEMGWVPFGQLELHLWATAVKRPALAGSPEKPREPYGVAELFRQCLACAATYRQRCVQSSRRLVRMAWGASALTGAFVLLALFFLVRPGQKPPSDLEVAVEAMRFDEKATPAERLSAPLAVLDRRREKLRRWQEDPEFATLPASLRQYVVSRYNEVDKYLEWVGDLNEIRRPVLVDTEADLKEVQAQLKQLGDRVYPEEWKGTEGLRLYQEQVAAVDALLSGIKRVQVAYLGEPTKARNLESFNRYRDDAGGVDWRQWSADLETLRREFKPMTFQKTDPQTYAAVQRFDTVREAETLRPRLERERDLAAALGLTGPLPDRPPVLVIEKPPTFSLSMANDHMDKLRKAYPHYEKEFTRADLPEVMLREMARAAATNYEALLAPARDRVLSQLPKEGDDEARWNAVRTWLLSDPEELAAWRKLAVLLAQLHDSSASDPVSALAAFLKEPSFSLDAQRLSLELPDSLRRKIPATAALSIYHPRTSGKEAALVLVQSEDVGRPGAALRFEQKKSKALKYLPGDELWATLALPDNKELLWAQHRTDRFQFECLMRPPLLHKVGSPNDEGEVLDGVRVIITPPAGWPRVPDLLPVVRGLR